MYMKILLTVMFTLFCLGFIAVYITTQTKEYELNLAKEYRNYNTAKDNNRLQRKDYNDYTFYWAKISPRCGKGHRHISVAYDNRSGDNCVRMHYYEQKNLPLTALASFPGSGNTWIRHLIQQTTGIYTGSIYNSSVLLEGGGFPGERFQDGRVIVVKTHQYREDILRYQRVVLLIRNPFDAILAEYNREISLGNKTAVASKRDFHAADIDWRGFVSVVAKEWLVFHEIWLQHPCVYIQVYEELLRDLKGQMQRLALVLGVRSPISAEHLSCVAANSQGRYKREKPGWMVPAMKLYTPHQRKLIKQYMAQLNGLLAHYNKTLS